MRYSPFYLKRHPLERRQGDISYIQDMAEAPALDGDELATVEDVFEKHAGTFDRLMSHSDASQQMAQIQSAVKSGHSPDNKRLQDYIQL
jgi:hypothetical protein